ncbi:MAG TPA: metallophosphoesterase [Candidatus Nanoarchaeia archaeon]|nr:metallophosphoesterase [Candidatus Nanoarchaeia archaeon]
MATDLTTLPPTRIPRTEPAKNVGIISDTHIPTRTSALPASIFQALENVDYIIHAGDLVELNVIDELEQIAPVLAVHGNMDTPTTKNILPKVNMLKIMNWTIGVTHDPSTTYGTSNLNEIAKLNQFNVLIFGHTHKASIVWEGKTLCINPGSPTDPQPHYQPKPTVAVLKVTKDTLTPRIVEL